MVLSKLIPIWTGLLLANSERIIITQPSLTSLQEVEIDPTPRMSTFACTLMLLVGNRLTAHRLPQLQTLESHAES